jgi:hypothetical protein
MENSTHSDKNPNGGNVQRIADEDFVNFGDLPEAVNGLLQKGVMLYRRDRAAADLVFREALALDPEALPIYLCLYKIHTYQGNLDEALAMAKAGAAKAASQLGLSADWRQWQRHEISAADYGVGRFALYTLKAMAFIHLRRDEKISSDELLRKLAELDALESVGGTVIADLSAGVR